MEIASDESSMILRVKAPHLREPDYRRSRLPYRIGEGLTLVEYVRSTVLRNISWAKSGEGST